MGLSTTHGCWSGSYGSFTRWRNALAEAAGYRIVTPRNGMQIPQVDLDWRAFEDKNYYGEWDRPPGDDPLLYLIVHSDCEGLIHPREAGHIAKRLEALLPELDEDRSAGGGFVWSMRGVTEQFIDGLHLAVLRNEDVEFR